MDAEKHHFSSRQQSHVKMAPEPPYEYTDLSPKEIQVSTTNGLRCSVAIGTAAALFLTSAEQLCWEVTERTVTSLRIC